MNPASSVGGLWTQFDGSTVGHCHVNLDNFVQTGRKASVYILSHLHEDHCKGLSSDMFSYLLQNQSKVTFLCHPVTYQLMLGFPKYRHLAKYTTVLDYCTSKTVNVYCPDTWKLAYKLEVVFFDARHCPGSVMVLLQSGDKRSLYTGDFRDPWVDGYCFEGLDALYLDTTFALAPKRFFPSRAASLEAIYELALQCLGDPTGLFHLEFPCNLGYEDILTDLSCRFGTKIHLAESQFQLYQNVPHLQNLGYFGESQGDCQPGRVHASFGRPGLKGSMGCGCPVDQSVMTVRISAQRFLTDGTRDVQLVQKLGPNKWGVFYSFHCSPDELEMFLVRVKPGQIVSTVFHQKPDAKRSLGEKLKRFVSAKESDQPALLGQLKVWRKEKTVVEPTSSDEELDFGEN